MSSRGNVRSRRGRAWDEESIRAALSEFLQGWEVWPTYEQFIQGGGKGLRDALASIGGVQKWAAEMGLPGGDRARGGVKKWNDETIRATLAEFFGDRTTWPTHGEFDEAGLHALYEALRFYGGVERWAKEMGVVRRFERPAYFQPTRRGKATREAPAARSSDWPKWTEQRIAAELATFLAGHEEWPRHKEFVEAGRKSLYHAILKHGGTHAWAERMGVRWVKRHGGHLPQWTEPRVRAQLSEFLGDRRYWPSSTEFRAARQSGLLRAIGRLGGVEHWMQEFGLQRAPRQRKSGAARRPASRKAG